jgi:hypothetical protein
MSLMVAFRGGSESGPLEASTHAVSLADEGVGGSGWAAERRKLKAPKVCFLSKSCQFLVSGARNGEQ